MTLGEAFDLNPTVKLPKGMSAPFVEMASLVPFTRDVSATQDKPYGGGMKFCDGDVLMARITPSLENGKTSIYRAAVDRQGTPAFGSTEFIVIRGKEGVSSTDFAYYLFTSPEVRDHAISSMNGSSGRQRVQHDSLSSFEIDLPTLEEQRAIAATLGALDDKIESNRQISRTMMSLAEAHFAKAIRHEQVSWVPFDEVVHRLNVVHKHNGKSVGSKGRTIVLDQSSEGVLGYHDGEPEFLSTPAAPICLFGDHTCTWRLGLGKFDVGPNVIPVVPKKESRVDPLWMYFGLKGAQQFQEYRRHWMEFRRHEVPWVDNSTQLSFVDAVRPAIGMAHELTNQSTRLREIRDALLPELLSGRIRVADVEVP